MPVVIVGGGITGLSAAWSAVKAGREVTIIEPGIAGGLLRTEHIEGCVVECGADSWIRTKPWLRELAVELGLGRDVIACNEARRKTYIFRRGRMEPLPRGLRLVAPAEWWPLLGSGVVGWSTKVRMLREVFHRKHRTDERTVAEFVRDHFGQEAVDYLAEPLFAGVYGGSPEQLSASAVLPKLVEYERDFGSVIRGARRDRAARGPLFESMRDGLGQIPLELVKQLGSRVSWIRVPPEAVEAGRVRVAGGWLKASQIILACGTPAAALLLAGSEAGALLGGIAHSSATIFAFGFRRSEIAGTPRGFGFLVPRVERRHILAATWVTSKFAGRAPDGIQIVRCFVPGIESDALTSQVLQDLTRVSGVSGKAFFSRVYQWPDSLPQFGLGHAALIQQIQRKLPNGVALAGAVLGAVGMPDCVRSGEIAVSSATDSPPYAAAPG